MHGAGGGAPKGNRNALKQASIPRGDRDATMVAELTRQARELVETID